VYAKYKDNAGNWSTAYNDTIILDTLAPTTTATPGEGTYNSAQSVTLSSNETATIYYTTNGTTPTTASSVYSSPISLATNATTTVKYFAKDTAGNSETVKTQTYTIDTLAPTGTINSNATYASTATVTLNLAASNMLSDVSQLQLSSSNNMTWPAPEPLAVTKSRKFTAGNGTKACYVKFNGVVGNWSLPYSDDIMLNPAVRIEAGDNHTTALEPDGSLWA
jgi:hypothetical protein